MEKQRHYFALGAGVAAFFIAEQGLPSLAILHLHVLGSAQQAFLAFGLAAWAVAFFLGVAF
ncbi:MAG: hypothetical protein Q8898_05860 [Bacillota bacterium]|nr:hypothetical protein [Bacillota bacterium]